VDVARQDGLDQPLAVTARWDGDEASNESSWQEEVVRAIGAVHWEIVRPGTDLDLLGAEATSVLERTGLLWPAPSYAFLPMMRLAAGGTFLSGEGGDEAFGLYPLGRLWSSVRGHRVPRSSDLRALALCCLPRPLRRRRWQHNDPPYQSWLRADAFALVAHDLADEMADDPLRFDRYLAISRQRRSADLTLESLGSVAALEGARYVAPLLDQGFLASLAAWGGPFGRGDRTGVMEALFANLLPGQILSRTSKATFGGVFWGPEARRFAQQWDGTGLDPGLVDAEALRREWLADVPVHAATLPLHAAWLYDRNRR
jgi:asparagine synthase (glutamine-hydrolysing)